MNTTSFDLDMPLFRFSGESGGSIFSVRDSVEGIGIFGGIGSGKSNFSARFIALKLLAASYGGLVLCCKKEERQAWEEYCRLTNRQQDLIIVGPNDRHFFDVLGYEASGKDKVTYTQNIVQVLKTVIRASEEKSSGKSDDKFWESAVDMLMYNVIDLCLLAYGKLSIEDMYNIVMTAPKKGQPKEPDRQMNAFENAFTKAQKRVKAQVDAFQNNLSDQDKKRLKDPAAFVKAVVNTIPDAAVMEGIDQFFCESYRNLADKTRSIVEFSFSGFLFSLMKEPVHSLFFGHASTFVPEDCYEKGKIILLDLPVKHLYKAGRDVQVLFKYIWQRAMERRDIEKNNRPCFCFADEAQHFLHEYDAEYQATARSSRIATVYISQNLPNYFANMGGDSSKSENKVKSFLGTLGTKIFHANADIDTNRYASELIGDFYTENLTRGVTVAGEFSANHSASYVLERAVRPEMFGRLKTGGPDLVAEAFVHRQGRLFDNGQNFKKIIFKR